MDKVGKEGVITVDESNTFGMEPELTEGMNFDKVTSPVTSSPIPSAWSVVLDEPHVLLVDGKVFWLKDLLPVLREGSRPVAR